MSVQPGDIVQFKIDEGVVRPLLVVSTAASMVSGELFLDGEGDGMTTWARANMFYAPTADLRTTWVKNVLEGPAVGEWQKILRVQFTPPPPRKRPV